MQHTLFQNPTYGDQMLSFCLLGCGVLDLPIAILEEKIGSGVKGKIGGSMKCEFSMANIGGGGIGGCGCLSTGSAAVVTTSFRNESDRIALLAIKSQIPDDPLGALTSWNDSLHHCDWQGITCSRRHRQRVTVLDLQSQKLGGTLSPYIGNLSFLKEIILTENNFEGDIPQEIGHLFRLQYLILANNSFEGEIPSNITYCPDLREINLIDNKLSGRIFNRFSSLSKLIGLGLASNNFIGKIPPSLGNLTSLARLSLVYNHLEGNIPDDLCSIRSLSFFQVSSNNLTGIAVTAHSSFSTKDENRHPFDFIPRLLTTSLYNEWGQPLPEMRVLGSIVNKDYATKTSLRMIISWGWKEVTRCLD